jgi:beta-glucosidase
MTIHLPLQAKPWQLTHSILIRLTLAPLAACLVVHTAAVAAAEPGSVSDRATALLAQMTTDEKISQLTLSTGYGAVTGPVGLQHSLEDEIRQGRCGNVFNVMSVAQVSKLQKIAVQETRLHIPLLFGYDIIHGYKTIFPICLGEAASWNPALIEQSERVAATEGAAAGLEWTFAPMVDIARDPRWGRISEGAGEDPFLGSAIARARVQGLQGTNLAAPDTLLACVKHYAAYGAVLAGRDYNSVDMSERTLREVYLPPYQAAVAAGALSVMAAFNELNGTPCTANRFLLQQVLRDEWGFTGFVVTDYTAINELVAHGTARDDCEAARQALDAGVDMDLQGGTYSACLKELLAAGKISQSQIDTAARRILEVKFKLGLFDDPFRRCDAQREKQVLYAPENLAAAYRMACESCVLLKNQGQTLPLKTGANIAVIGPLADAKRDLLGSWKGEGDWNFLETVLGAIRQDNTNGTVTYARGCDIDSTNRNGFAAAVTAAQNADVVVLVLGESCDMSGEAKSRTSLNLPGVQTELLREIKQTSKPVVVVLMNGRPLALEEESRLADALLETWFPGTEGGRATADLLFGRQNPSGKLPATFPRNVGQVPIFYAAKNTGRPLDPARPGESYKSSYLDCPNDPLYPFGFGLSYTTFNYSQVRLDGATLRPGGTLTATVTVTNTGARAGAEVVQLYLRQLVGSVTRPVRELKGFQKIELQAGESRAVTFSIGDPQLRFLRADMTVGTEPGKFQVFVGPNSRDTHAAAFELIE